MGGCCYAEGQYESVQVNQCQAVEGPGVAADIKTGFVQRA